MSNFIHPLSDVKTVNIGEKTHIWQFCVILEKAIIGKNCNINSLCFIENDVIIGDNVTIKSGVQLWDGLRVEDNVFIGPNVTFTNHLYPRSKKHPNSFPTTILKRGASIGANSTILGGIQVGPYALIGAGSVVTKNVGQQELWYGNPACHRGYVCVCAQKLDKNYYCLKCNKKYFFDGKIK